MRHFAQSGNFRLKGWGTPDQTRGLRQQQEDNSEWGKGRGYGIDSGKQLCHVTIPLLFCKVKRPP